MNIGICDDLLEEREHLKALLLSHAPSFTILEYTSGEALLAGLTHGDKLDLLFLDIYMDGINGMETAQTMRKTHKDLPIIFLTTSPDFALSAFDVRAAGYLLKPVDQVRLLGYLGEYTTPPQDSWLIATPAGDVLVPINQLLYCEQQGRYNQVHMLDGTVYPLRMTFSEVVSQLAPYPEIAPCGRALLVNLYFVHTLNRQDLTLTNGTKLPVPRRTQELFREAYLAFYRRSS